MCRPTSLPFVLLAACLFLGCTSQAHPDTSPSGIDAGPSITSTDVFTPTRDGEDFGNYRIPGLAVTQEGTLLAFAEGRRERSDHHHGPIVLRRSTDGGATWSDLQIVAESGRDSLNNPTPVILPDSGRILVFYQLFPSNFHSRAIPREGVEMAEPGYEGPRVVRTFLVTSDDDGATWSDPRDLTEQMKRDTPVVANFTGPGIAIVLKYGEHVGRIVVPSCDFVMRDGRRIFRSYCCYSDDQGGTWTMGDHTPHADERGNGNETQVEELTDGRLILTVRARGQRQFAYSDDGGATWSELIGHPDVPDSGCMGSILRYDMDNGESLLLYSGSAGRINGRRSIGTIFASLDNGKTFPHHRVYHPGSFDYSSMVRLPNGDVGLLAECDHGVAGRYNTMRFFRVNLAWLLEQG